MSKTRARVTIIVDEEHCKGCGLCVDVCPHQALALAAHINSRGFHPAALVAPEKCTACAQCALMCPDACMKILKDE
jgi:2-oxoglutarate ferredoxin oxidoreductase subunit delta